MTSLATLTTHLTNTFDPAAVREYETEKRREKNEAAMLEYLTVAALPHERHCFSWVSGTVLSCSCRRRAVLEAARDRYRAAFTRAQH